MFNRGTESEIVQKYLGVPYKHKGRSMTGLDCYGLILAIKQDLGYPTDDVQFDYEEDWSSKGSNLMVENYWQQWEKVAQPRPGDVVLFYVPVRGLVDGQRIANHAGVVLFDGKFIHSVKVGVVVTALTNERWAHRIEGFYRLKVENEQ